MIHIQSNNVLLILFFTSVFHFTTATADASTESAYFAICAAIKDTPANVKEWVDYHVALGAGKIYLMDTDDPHPERIQSALAHHISSGHVEFYSLPRVNPQTISLLQVRLYDICLNSVRNRHQFIGFWDVDEFLVPRDPGIDFPAFLKQFEQYGGLAVGWRVVGPSGHIKKPSQGGVVANYRSCTAWDFVDNEEIKTIVNTRYALHPTSDPHTFVYENDKYAVDAEGNAVEGARNVLISGNWQKLKQPPKLALYHYVTKSREDYLEKMKRGSAMGNRKGWEYYNRIESAANVKCDEGAAMCEKLRVPSCEGLLLEKGVHSQL